MGHGGVTNDEVHDAASIAVVASSSALSPRCRGDAPAGYCGSGDDSSALLRAADQAHAQRHDGLFHAVVEDDGDSNGEPAMIFTARLQVRIWRPKDYAKENQMRFQAGVAMVGGFYPVLRLRYRLSRIGDGGSGWEAGYASAERTGRTRFIL